MIPLTNIRFALLAVFAFAPSAFSQMQPTAQYPLGFSPYMVAIGDMNGDGNQDVVSATLDNVGVSLGNSSGILGTQWNIFVGGNSEFATIGDLNNDGKIDLITPGPSALSISARIGSGTSIFSSPIVSATSHSTQSVAIVDLNGDGKVDLVATGDNSAVSILFGTGTGSFDKLYPPFEVAPNPRSVAVGDFNVDGKVDVVVVNQNPNFNCVSVLLGNSAGTFNAPYMTFPVGPDPSAVVVGDLNLDGIVDLAATNFMSHNISVLIGTGTGSFGVQATFPVINGPYSLVICDPNSDGRPDLAAPNSSANGVGAFLLSVLPGNGDGTFGVQSTFPIGIGARSIATGYLDSDGISDLVTGNAGTQDVSVLLAQGPSVGLAAYGAGTSGCIGAHVLTANSNPYTGNSRFKLNCNNAPLNALGLGLVTDSQDLFGSDLFGIGVLLHTDLVFANEVLSFDFYSNSIGNAIAVTGGIPNNPILVGKTFFAQALWSWSPSPSCFFCANCASPPYCPNLQSPCWHFPYGLSSSNGLAITIW